MLNSINNCKNNILSKESVEQWRTNGFVVVRNIINKDDIDDSYKLLLEKFPNTRKYYGDFGSNNKMDFPTGTVIDKVTMSESIITAVKTLLNTDNIHLTQSDAWAKVGINERKPSYNADQRMHMDYGNHTFLHPSSWEEPEAVAAIVYFSNIQETGGGTALVPKMYTTEKLYKKPYLNMPGQKNIKFINDKYSAESYIKKEHPQIYNFRQKLYENEIKISPKIGDVLFYRLDLWHRGTPVNMGRVRRVLNLAWKKSSCSWINNWNPGFTKRMYYGDIEKMFEELSPLQRGVLGIPLPGDKYWTHEKLLYLKERYKNFNTIPYLSKL